MLRSHTPSPSTLRFTLAMGLLLTAIVALIGLCLFVGSSALSAEDVWQALLHRGTDTTSFIVWETRLPALLTALLAGVALGVTGLVMQTVFANPLADPGVLGVNAGAALGVAIVILAFGGNVALKGMMLSGFLLTVGAALLGAGVVLGILTLCSSIVRHYATLLIIGVMVSYLASSLISLLNFHSTAQGISAFVFWGFGDFGSLTSDRICLLALAIAIGCAVLFFQAKALNALLLGDNYARSVGISVRRSRTILILLAGWLSAVVTATCGPISFIGLAVPHIVRLCFRTANHLLLLPLCALTGSALALLCHFASQLPQTGILPINALTPIIGVPIVLYLLIRGRAWSAR